MRWFSKGWFIGAKSWGENSYIATTICEHGIWKGLLRKKQVPITMSFNNISWSSRDIKNLGNFKIEYISVIMTLNIFNKLALSEILINWCNERDPIIYQGFLESLSKYNYHHSVKYFAIFAINQWGIGKFNSNINNINKIAEMHNYKKLSILTMSEKYHNIKDEKIYSK